MLQFPAGLHGAFQFPEPVLDPGQQLTARLGQFGVAAVAAEQPHAEMSFEVLDLLADGCRGDVQFLGGSGKAQVPSHRAESAKRIEGRELGFAGHI